MEVIYNFVELAVSKLVGNGKILEVTEYICLYLCGLIGKNDC